MPDPAHLNDEVVPQRSRPFVRTQKFWGGLPLGFGLGRPPQRPTAPATEDSPITAPSLPAPASSSTSVGPARAVARGRYPSSLSVDAVALRPSVVRAGLHKNATRLPTTSITRTDDAPVSTPAPVPETSQDAAPNSEEERDALLSVKYSCVRAGKKPMWFAGSVDQKKLGIL